MSYSSRSSTAPAASAIALSGSSGAHGGPACLVGEPLTATLDAADAVDERDEDDNVLVAACPP